jgi:hypothetical protein
VVVVVVVVMVAMMMMMMEDKFEHVVRLNRLVNFPPEDKIQLQERGRL